jgi:hypothetical protein
MRDRRCRDRIGCIATYVISVYNYQRCELESSSGAVYSIQHHVIKSVSNLRQVGGLLLALRFPPLIKLTARYNWNSVDSGVKHRIVETQ